MTEEELRALVRAAIARHAEAPSERPQLTSVAPCAHPSHEILSVPAGSEMDGPCLIEPAVTCNDCGYCKSMGH
jgi:hypothetical protein